MKYHCIKQYDISDCGAACLATICKQRGYKIGITKIREIAGTDQQGTNVYGLITAAEHLGFRAKAVKGDKESLLSSFVLPAIAHVISNGNLLHYVVIHRITPQEIVIADPGVGIVKMSIEEFLGEKTDRYHYQWTGILILLEKDVDLNKIKEEKSWIVGVWELLVPQRRLIGHILITSLLYIFLGLLGTFYFQELVDNILPHSLVDSLWIFSIGIIILNVFKLLLSWIRAHLLLYLSQKLDITILFGYYCHIIKLPMNFFSTRKVGEIVSRFNDASKIRDAISGITLTIIIDTLMVILGSIILYSQSVKLFLLTLLVVFFYGVIVFAFNNYYRKMNQETMEANAKLSAYMIESINGIQTIKSNNAEYEVITKVDRNFSQLLKKVFRFGCISNLQFSLKNFVEVLGGSVIMLVGGLSVIEGEMTMGNLITFNSLLIYFLDPMKNLINLQPQLQTVIVAVDRVREILELEVERHEEETKKLSPAQIDNSISLQNVDFRYGTRELVLKNLSLQIPTGKKIAFVGESGSGKTTVAKLLLNLYSIEKGDIWFGGYNIQDLKIEFLRSHIAYVTQETFLFSGTVYENLTLGLPLVSMEEVIKATKIAQAHEFIESLPFRYQTQLEENGANLSGGQRQRLAIARALLKRPSVLILDESTSNLDTFTENTLISMIHQHLPLTTIIFIAHRLNIAQNCDEVVVFSRGEIVEMGTPQELSLSGGIYAKLFHQQNQGVL